MSGILDDLIKAIEEPAQEPKPESDTHSMFSHSSEFEKYAKEEIVVDDNRG